MSSRSDAEQEETDFPWHLGVYDAHCHPTDTVSSLDKIPSMKTSALTIMATRAQDQDLVADFAKKLAITRKSIQNPDQGSRIVPAFGWHPWFSYQIYDDLHINSEQNKEQSRKKAHYQNVILPSPSDESFLGSLPQPRPLSYLLKQLRNHLEQYPLSLVGEIGLDRAFRIPDTEAMQADFQPDPSLTPGGREGRRLSEYRVNMAHQRKILTTQLNLAGELQRAVSVHGVAAHGMVFDTIRDTWRGHERAILSKRAQKRRASVDATHIPEIEGLQGGGEICQPTSLPFPPRICLHSYSGPPETVKQYSHSSVPATVFFSFSHLVNFSNSSNKAVDVIKLLPDDRILVESDLHAAGDNMDDLMEAVTKRICQIKGWSLAHGVTQLASNWKHFIFGDASVDR